MISTNVHAQIQQKNQQQNKVYKLQGNKLLIILFFQFVFGLTGTVILLSLNF